MTRIADQSVSVTPAKALVAVGLMVFLVPIAVWGLSFSKLENEVHNWLGGENTAYQTYHWYSEQFPSEESVILTWDGSHLNDPRTPAFLGEIVGVPDAEGIRRGGLKQVERVRTPSDLLIDMVKNDVPRDEALLRLQGVLLGAGPAKVRLSAEAQPRRIDIERQILAELQTKLGISARVLPVAATETLPLPSEAELAAYGDEAAKLATPDYGHDFQLDWDGLNFRPDQVDQVRELLAGLKVEGVSSAPVDAVFLTPGAPAAISVLLSEAGLAERQETFQLLKEKAAQVGIPVDTLRMAGRPVAGSQLNLGVLRAAWDKSEPWYLLHKRSVMLLSMVVGVALTIWMLRSLHLAALVLGSAGFTVLVSTALVPMTGGSMNMVVVVMPALLYVTTLSGAIHLANYWKNEAAVNPVGALGKALGAAITPCMWSSLTTALGLLSLMTSALSPIRDFGLYSAIGVVIALGVTLFGLPSLIALFPPRRPTRDEIDHADWAVYGGRVARQWKPILSIAAVVAIGGVAGLWNFRTETKVIRYFPESSRIVQDYVAMERSLVGIVPIDVLVRFDEAAQSELKFVERQQVIRQIQQRIKHLPDVSGSLSLADFLPTVPAPEEGANVRERAAYAAKSRTIEERVKTDERRGAATMLKMLEKPSTFNAAGDELWRITAQVAVMADNSYSDLTRQIEAICAEELRLVAGQGSEKFREVGQTVAYHPGASHFVTGMVPLFMATQDELLNSLIQSFGIAFVTIGLAISYVLRSPLAGALAMIPNVLPIFFVFGVISWCGVRVDIGSVITASIALGIAVDGTLHLLTWFRMGLEEGRSRVDAIANSIGHCGPAVYQTSLVVCLGLMMLYPAELVLVSRFGWLMTALVGAAMVADLVITPALLAGPLGAILERKVRLELAQGAQRRPDATQFAAASGLASSNGSADVAALASADAAPVVEAAANLAPRPHGSELTASIRRVDPAGK
jgi:uncharacterized protein